jgi:Ca-activated chloride channel family protein
MLEWAAPLWFLAAPIAVLAPWIARRPTLRWSSFGVIRAPSTVRSALSFLPARVPLRRPAAVRGRPRSSAARRPRDDGRRARIDILLVLDTSGSMDTEDYNLGGQAASRLTVAKEVIARFVDERAGDRIGLVVFGEEAFTQVPLTRDHDALKDILRQVKIGMAGERATAVGDGVGIAMKRLEKLEAPSKVAILLTDGRSNAGIEPMEAANAAKALGVRVYTIGVGSLAGDNTNSFLRLMSGGGRGNDVDERTLKAIADATGAEYFRAGDTEGLQHVYDTINELEKSPAEVHEFVHRTEMFTRFAMLGLGLGVLQILLANTLFRRLPVTWGHPNVLLGLWGIPVLALLMLLFGRRRKALVRKLGLLVSPEEAARTATAHTARAALQVVGVTCIVLAMAMPRWGFAGRSSTAPVWSSSWCSTCRTRWMPQDVSPSRLERAKRKIVDLSEMMTGDKVGLVQFAGGAFRACRSRSTTRRSAI